MIPFIDFIKIKNAEIKQAIVLRADLNMGKGKLVAQGCHASLSSFLKVQKTAPQVAEKWISEGSKKIVLKVNSEKELIEYYKKAMEIKIPGELIADAGLTQIKPGTKTAFALGPWFAKDIDSVVGKLKLL